MSIYTITTMEQKYNESPFKKERKYSYGYV